MPPRAHRIHAIVAILVACLLGGDVVPLVAQDPGIRSALSRFRDSLQTIDDSAAVDDLDAALARLARDRRDDAVAQLRYGLVALRASELGRPRHFGEAESAFERAARLEPSWPYPHYGRALVHAGVSEVRRHSRTELTLRVGVGELEEAIAALVRAVELEPSFTPALQELGRLPQQLRDPPLWSAALAALRRAPASARRHPEVLLALGRVEREAGSGDSALAAFERYRATGATPGLAQLELARTRFLLGLPGGAAAYYAGAADDDPTTVDAYRRDLLLIVGDSALADFDAARGPERAAVLRRFWTDRDRLELRTEGERLAEHYRRLFYARRHFAPAVTRRVYWPGCAYRSGVLELDDRGIVYLRHGEPSLRIRPYLFTVMPNESWRYERADGDLLFHFGASADPSDYRLMTGVLDLYGRCGGPRSAESAPPTPEMYLSRAELDPMYSKLAAWHGTSAGARLGRLEREIGRASLAIGTTSDSHELLFADSLPAALSVLALGQQGGRSLVHIVYAIPGAATRPEAGPDGHRHPIRLRFGAYDETGQVVAHLDSSVTLTTPMPVTADDFLFGRFVVPVPPGRWSYRLALQYGDSAGTVLPRDSLQVDRFDGGALGISDLALGWRPIALTWRRTAEDTVYFSPFRSYFTDAELELHYEVYGVEAGDELEATLTVSRRNARGLFRRTPSPVAMTSRSRANGPIAFGRRTVTLADLEPGEYRLELEVTDARGRRVRRETTFRVHDR